MEESKTSTNTNAASAASVIAFNHCYETAPACHYDMRAPTNPITGYQPLQVINRAAGRSNPYPSNFENDEQDDQLYASFPEASHSWEYSGCEPVPEEGVWPNGALPETVGPPKSVQPISPIIYRGVRLIGRSSDRVAKIGGHEIGRSLN